MNIRLSLLAFLAIALLTCSCQKVDDGIQAPIDKKKIEKEVLRFREEYKTARKKGVATTALNFYPRNEKVLHIRDGKLSWLSYQEKTEEYQRTKYASIEDVEGPFIKVAGCRCCVWISGRTRYVTDDGEEEEESWIDTYEDTDGGWRQTALSNSVDNPRKP